MILKTFHGCSNKEIAQKLEISVKTVEDHVTKSFRQLRHKIFFLRAGVGAALNCIYIQIRFY